ncbi:MAG: DUF885 family protein, partial [Chitinophagaceae bacterium]
MRYLILLLVLGIAGCDLEQTAEDKNAPARLDSLFREYYNFKKQINPIEATKAGFSEYNAQLQNYISAPYQTGLKEQYVKFLNALAGFDSASVSPAQWMSRGVMEWDCKIKLEGLNSPLITVASPMFDMPAFELMPLNQMQSLNLYFSQLAGGESIQPFNSVTDYDNWLRRVNVYLDFLDTAMFKMNIGIEKGITLPKVIINKMIPQIAVFANTA